MFELRLSCPENRVDTITEALQALDALSVSTQDAAAGTVVEQPLFAEPGLPPPAYAWARSELCALFAGQRAAQEAAVLLAAQDFFADCAIAGITPVPEADWVRLTQAQFAPVQITPAFWIVPTWHTPPAGAQTVIRLDPGLAFGTGAHPTTHMCLRWMAARASVQGKRVLDYGCGSGILAIGAALHGAAEVVAVDIDPVAVQATRANAAANGVALTAGLPGLETGCFDVVLANILAAPLAVLAPLLSGRVAPGGHLALAGLLARQAAGLQALYAQNGMALQVADEMDGWSLLAGTRATTLPTAAAAAAAPATTPAAQP
ncbi:MAG: 50S ribosomal protein L11 methyltransferase [Burkholderiaceae bacterium]|jgi:ribosomal protein L11 methyltransferase|nr:50S ribosomal protein L11 methyltransferase [Burkholderiaceae bacterium]